MEKINDLIAKEDVKFVDFRFTDTKGKWQHITYHANVVSEHMLQEGIMFDGSSIAGWKEIQDSDMMLRPELDAYMLDPFTTHPTLIVFCDVLEPNNHLPYSRDPRSTAYKAEQYLKSSGIGDTCKFGPELEFFIFDDVRFDVSMKGSFVSVESEESPFNNGKKYPEGNLGHRPNVKGGYFPVSPIDSFADIRSEMSLMAEEMGLKPILHHHEVAPAQNEIGVKYGGLLQAADNVQKIKYLVHNISSTYGKSATFMPKPVPGDNGSGMHVHQSIWKDGQPLFAGDKYANLSDIALYYIGGVMKHAKAINAFTNPTTNSYKRLVAGYEAPVYLAYSAENRSASIRIPFVLSSSGIRVETRFPDPSANPYYAFSALLMAGLDGIQNKIHPGDAVDYNLYKISDSEASHLGKVSHSLKSALDNLEQDHDFLLKGDVFSSDQIEAYLTLKREELEMYEHAVHPIEYSLYYSV